MSTHLTFRITPHRDRSRVGQAMWRPGVVWLLVAVLSGGACGLFDRSAEAGEWVFRRSYHSHDDSPGNLGAESPRSRAAYREAYVGAHPHFAIRGGWRNNFYTLRNGTTTDTTVIREHFFDAQYNGR